MGFDSKRYFTPPTVLPGASPLPWMVGYLFLVGSNILLLMVIQQQVVILEFSQEKMSACPSMPPFWDNLENSAVVTGLEKVSFILIPKKCNAKKCSNDDTIALISQASKVMLKVLQARLQQFMNHELPDV